MNTEIASLTDQVKDKAEEQQARVDEIEMRMNRQQIGPESTPVDFHAEALLFYTARMKQVPDYGRQFEVSQEQVDDYKAYKEAYGYYMRYGIDAMPTKYRNAMSVGSDPDGGYWVTPDKTGRIATLVYETSPMRQLANVQQIGSDHLEGFNDLDQAASGGWVGEAAVRPVTGTPKIGKWDITVHEQYASPKTTQKLLDDSVVDPEAWLSGKIAGILARTETTTFFNGNGVSKPRGFLTYVAGTPSFALWPVIQQNNTGAAGAYAATDPADALITTLFNLKTAYRPNARWFMSRSTLGTTRKLKDGQGNYMWEPDLTQLGGSRLLGFPVAEGEDMPVIAADSLSVAFGDFREAYQIVDRFGIRVLRDPFTDKPNVIFYSTKRVGGDVVNFEAIKLLKFAA
ncbi:hypothetical protein LCGC14_2676570, partial [marine sediment metagenome]